MCEDFDPFPEAGWLLVPEAQGRGLGREAAMAAHDWFDHIATGPAVARIPERNERSMALAEHLNYKPMRALDPAIMPAVIAPTAGGLDYGTALDLCLAVAARAEIAVVAMVEFMPKRDLACQSARTAGQLLVALMEMIAGQVAQRRG